MNVDKDTVRIQHMYDATCKAVEFTKNCIRDDLDSNEMLSLSLVRLLEIIGEGAKAVSEEMKTTYPEIPWKQITGTRDRLIHGYFDVDYDIIWSIVTMDLPDLKVKLQQILKNC